MTADTQARLRPAWVVTATMALGCSDDRNTATIERNNESAQLNAFSRASWVSESVRVFSGSLGVEHDLEEPNVRLTIGHCGNTRFFESSSTSAIGAEGSCITRVIYLELLHSCDSCDGGLVGDTHSWRAREGTVVVDYDADDETARVELRATMEPGDGGPNNTAVGEYELVGQFTLNYQTAALRSTTSSGRTWRDTPSAARCLGARRRGPGRIRDVSQAGAARWSATGLENRGALTRSGSIPPPSAFCHDGCAGSTAGPAAGRGAEQARGALAVRRDRSGQSSP